jgi:hypothetical protein
MKRAKPPELPEIADEPGMTERFQRGLRNLLNTPPQHRTKPPTKTKDQSATKGGRIKRKAKR